MQLFLYRTEKIKKKEKKNVPIALFTVTPSHPHDNAFERGCEKGYCTTLKEYS